MTHDDDDMIVMVIDGGFGVLMILFSNGLCQVPAWWYPSWAVYL